MILKHIRFSKTAENYFLYFDDMKNLILKSVEKMAPRKIFPNTNL